MPLWLRPRRPLWQTRRALSTGEQAVPCFAPRGQPKNREGFGAERCMPCLRLEVTGQNIKTWWWFFWGEGSIRGEGLPSAVPQESACLSARAACLSFRAACLSLLQFLPSPRVVRTRRWRTILFDVVWSSCPRFPRRPPADGRSSQVSCRGSLAHVDARGRPPDV